VPRPRTITPALPSETGVHHGLAFSLWLPENPSGGVVVLHGAGSCKENHHDFARAALGGDLAAIAFDQRGHGESEGAMDGRALDDIAQMAALLRSRLPDPEHAPIALRGSSMGGYLALVAAEAADARAVVAICPADAEGLRRGLDAGRLTFAADAPAVAAFLETHDAREAIAALEDVPVLLLHAEGDEQVPVEHSRELAALMRSPRSRLIVVPGGHHRSAQHDPDLQAVSIRFIERALARTDS
jgi:pimeloyl-ACP methyl ester carboxylesterase